MIPSSKRFSSRLIAFVRGRAGCIADVFPIGERHYDVSRKMWSPGRCRDFLRPRQLLSVVGIVVFAAASYPHTVSAAIVLASVIGLACREAARGSRRHRDPSVPYQCSGRATRRSPPAHRGDAVARPGKVADQSQGVQLATMQQLARYWRTDYDWRKVEARLNALPQFITEIDGLDIHFIHVRSKHENALPIIVTHGWPGSIIEQLKIIDPLTNPTAHGGKRIGRFRCRDSVAAGLRVFRQADRRPAGIPSASHAPGSC